MDAVVNGKGGDAEALRLGGEQRCALFKGERGEAAAGMYFDDGFVGNVVNFRRDRRFGNATLQGAQYAGDAVDAMRAAGIAFGTDDDSGNGGSVRRRQAATFQHAADQRL